MARLLIKHAVGGITFLDSDANLQVKFEISTHDNKTWIIAHLPAELEQDMSELLKWKHELNIFVFEELDSGRLQKTWYYMGDGGLHYDGAQRVLRINSSHELRYFPSNYLA